ncbi:hypothetical protein SEPCBS119000_000524 [Sporothrix epigloea]|uniref:Homeobox domain-containing protein n=1 Tax=Sporothrix epigloea TaxID=1892477 RepID=A0ABP0D5M0_9PEZI
MESALPAPSTPAAVTLPDADVPTELLPSSPRSTDSSTTDKADVSVSFSDTGDQSTLRHPKGKRKRTAAKDKSILESSYQANPKPDKTARLDIVRQVSLSEKEVQIWFQNRRQNDRRKSRPLSPQEIAALRYGGMHAFSSGPSTPFSLASLSQHSSFSSDGHDTSSPPHHQFTSASMTNVLPSTSPASSPDAAPQRVESSVQDMAAEYHQRTEETNPSWSGQSTAPATAVTSAPESHSFSRSIGSIGYLANRWNTLNSLTAPTSPRIGETSANNHSHLGREEPTRLENIVQPSYSTPLLPPPQQQTHVSSHQIKHRPFRLSLSLEGKAEFVSPVPHPPRLLRGRSRDVHAWESVCDAEARVDDELSAHAEQEASGSAIAAINLLRSTSALSNVSNASPSSGLQHNNQKRNTASRSALPREGAKRTKMARALSSVARMQNIPNPRGTWQPQDNIKDKTPLNEEKKKLKLSTLLSGNDSDKENWSPDGEGRVRPLASQPTKTARRPLPTSRNGTPRLLPRINGSKYKSSSQLSAVRGSKAGTFDGVDIYEDSAPRTSTPKRAPLSRAATAPATDDVERFMRGAQVSPSKKGDMDCIAGLLSLSQGNWR